MISVFGLVIDFISALQSVVFYRFYNFFYFFRRSCNTLFPGFKELESLSFSVMVAFGDSSPVLLREKRRDSGMLKNIEELCNPEGDLQVQIELSTLHLSEKPEAPSTKPRENLHLLEHLTDPEFCERLPVGK